MRSLVKHRELTLLISSSATVASGITSVTSLSTPPTSPRSLPATTPSYAGSSGEHQPTSELIESIETVISTAMLTTGTGIDRLPGPSQLTTSVIMATPSSPTYSSFFNPTSDASPTTTLSSAAPCSMCPGWPCNNYNDCHDPYPCDITSGISGTCASTSGIVPATITHAPSSTSPCSMCPGWPCTTYNDCNDPYPCDTTSGISGTCASTAGTVRKV